MSTSDDQKVQEWIEYGLRSRELLYQGVTLVFVNAIRAEIYSHLLKQAMDNRRPEGPLVVRRMFATTDLTSAVGWDFHLHTMEFQRETLQNILQEYVDSGDIPEVQVKLREHQPGYMFADITFSYPF